MASGPINVDYQGSRGTWRASMANFNARYMSGHFGQSLKAGAAESFGWNIEGFAGQAKSHGFLGWKKWGSEFAEHQTRLAEKSAARVAAGGVPVKYMGTRAASRVALGTLGKSIPLLSTAYFGYTGYQQEGIWGATKGVAESVLWSSAFHYVGGALGGAGGIALAGAAVAGGVVAGTYLAGEAGRAHAKGLRQLEMGGSDQIQDALSSAGAATMRQRSLMALNNTHLNGRMSLGNEAMLMHRSFGF